MLEYTFANAVSYNEAWTMCMCLGLGFKYTNNEGNWSIHIDPEQEDLQQDDNLEYLKRWMSEITR